LSSATDRQKRAALIDNPRSAPLCLGVAMSWKYSQATGELRSPAGSCVGVGYSGHGAGVNNPTFENVAMVGPIPRGLWGIDSFFDDAHGKGPVVAHLTPAPGTETFGRSGFMLHGDNAAMDRTASEGCIVLPRSLREMVMSSGDRALVVSD
jgi:hypothetical protein